MRTKLRLLPALVILFSAAAVGVGPSPAVANHCGGSGYLIGAGGEASASCHLRGPGSEPTVSLTPEEQWNRYCGYQVDTGSNVDYVAGATVAYDYRGGLDADRVAQLNYDPTGEYASFVATCSHPDPGGSGIGGEFIYTVTPPVPVEFLRDQARARIIIDDPLIETNPSFTDRFTVVNIETWLWVDQGYWDTDYSDDESAGTVTVAVWAEPVDVYWNFPTAGVDETCLDPGTPWTPGATATSCSVVFEGASAGQTNDAFQGESTVSWQFYWSINGADQGPFDDLFEATTPFELQVGEIQAVES